MCGIAGILAGARAPLHPSLHEVCRRMAVSLSSRGPDDEGVWVDAPAGIALGHRRLAVVDLSPEGHQPMVSADGRWVLGYNGEIYNHLALRADLEARGVRFRGSSDTEVLLEAIASWGLDAALRRCNGMFALALWDREDRTLSLARDRLGEKPLYYGVHAGRLLFASELKALHAVPEFAPTLDVEALALYLRYSRVPAPHCVFQGFHKLPAATIVEARCDGTIALGAPRPYWSLLDAARAGSSGRARAIADDTKLVDETEEKLRQAVGLRMGADVPLGAFLSGGVDSSLVVALMQAQSSTPVRTFCVGFGSDGHDEAPYARQVAAHLRTEHTEVYLRPEDALQEIPHLARIFDEPFADSSQLPTYLVSRVAREHVTVCLSGDGGDEIFGGYNHYRFGRSLWRRLDSVPLTARRCAAGLAARVPASATASIARAAAGLIPGRLRPANADRKVLRLIDVLPAESREDLYFRLVAGFGAGDMTTARARSARAWFEAAGAIDGLCGYRDWMMAMDALTYLPDDILVKVDRASMAVSLETRVPLLDHTLVEHAWALPAETRMRDGKGKWLLRQVLARHVPRALIERPKMGFAVPLGEWLRGPLREWAGDLLEGPDPSCGGLLDAGRVRAALSAHVRGRREVAHPLWTVLMLQAWRAEWGV